LLGKSEIQNVKRKFLIQYYINAKSEIMFPCSEVNIANTMTDRHTYIQNIILKYWKEGKSQTQRIWVSSKNLLYYRQDFTIVLKCEIMSCTVTSSDLNVQWNQINWLTKLHFFSRKYEILKSMQVFLNFKIFCDCEVFKCWHREQTLPTGWLPR